MKRIISTLIIVTILFVFFSNIKIIAENEPIYYNVQIPIFYGTTKDFSTEMLNGITTSPEQNKGKIFIDIDDFQKLSNAELINSNDNTINLKRNTVYLKLYINNNKADLSLGFNDDNSTNSFNIEVPTIKYKNKVYISLIHGLNAFSVEMNIIGKEDILNMISVNNQITNDEYMNSSMAYLNNKIFDFEKYPKYLQISKSKPFDELFFEYKNHTLNYLFSWQSLYGLNDVTTSLGAIPSNFISNYDGLSDFVIGNYEADKRYYDILCTIINNVKSSDEMLDFSMVYESITFLSDTGITETVVSGNDILSFIISSTSDCLKASEKTANLIRCSDYQSNVLDKTLLNSSKLKENMIDDKIITDIVNFSIFNKYINNTYLSSLYNNQYALYQSADKLNRDIDNPIKNISNEWYNDMIYKTLTSIADDGLGVFTGGATEIPDILMKNIKYNNAVNNLILQPSEALGNIKDCYFIQETIRNIGDLDIFNRTEDSYYNFRLILQSSLTAYEILNKNNSLMDIVGEEGRSLVTNKINNLNSILSSIEKCDMSFYSTKTISNDIINIKDISIMIVPIEDETQSTEPVEIEETKNYEWHLNPTIEADNIIVPDYDNELFEKYAIIEKDGKYGVISNKGKIEVDCKYMGYEICSIHNIFIMANPIKDNNISKADYYKFENNKLVKTMSGGHCLDRIYYVYDKSLKKSFSIGLGYMEEYIDEKAFPAQEVFKKNERGYYDEYGKWGIISGDSVIKNFEYDNGRYSDNLVALEKNELWGYFDQNGKELIPFIAKRSDYINHEQFISSTYNYDNMAFMDVDGILAVNTKDGGCFYDIKGNQLTNSKEFEEVRPMINGFAWVKKDGKWGVIKFDSFDSDENSEDSSIEYIEQTENLIEFTYKENSIESLSSDGTLVYTTSAKYPIFEGENVKILNDEIQKSIVLEGLYQEDCDELLEDWKELQFPLPTYDKYEFTVTYNHNGYISIIEYGANNGGYMSSIYYFYTSFIYDINAKKLVKYSDFFDMNEKELQQLVFSYSDLSSSQRKFYSIETATLTQDGMKFYLSDGPHAKRHEVTIPFSDSNFKIKLLEKTNNSTSENTSAKNNKGTVKIEDGYLNVRESPSTSGKIIGKLYNGDKVTIEETSEDEKWIKISKDNINGYVSKEYIN